MKYKIGDKVTIREDLIVNEKYGREGFTSEMEKYEGKTYTIKKVDAEFNRYRLAEIDWWWTDEMFFADTRNLLLPGRVVECYKESTKRAFYAAIAQTADGNICLSSEKTWFPIDCFKENLKYTDIVVMKIYDYSSTNDTAWKVSAENRKLLWDRKEEKKEMTIAEIEKKLGYSIKIIKEEE